MINMDIQELFDGSLGDERTAELLHSLSVSPEKRADFRRHMALQGAIQADRVDNRLTSDEDSAIWGAITGLSAVASGAGSGYSFAWLAKGALFVMMGVVGYLLGSNEYTNIFGSSASRASKPSAPSATRTALPHVVIVPVPLPSVAAADASRVGVQGNAGIPVRSGSNALIASSAPATRQSRSRADNRMRANSNTSAPSSATDQGGNANNSVTRPNTSTSPVSPLLTDTSGGTAAQHSNGNGAASDPLKDTAAKPSTQQADANATQQPLNPDEVAKAMGGSQGAVPTSSNSETRALALRTNGFEVAYSERIGVLAKIPDAAESDPTFTSRCLDVSYRLYHGILGLGGRIGYGGFSLKSLSEGVQLHKDANGNINRVNPYFQTTVEPTKNVMGEFFVNFRIPMGDRFALGAEGHIGGTAHTLTSGSDVFLLWMVTERFGVQAGGGYSRYWYKFNEVDLQHALLSAGEGASVDANYTTSTAGSLFETKYGIFYRF